MAAALSISTYWSQQSNTSSSDADRDSASAAPSTPAWMACKATTRSSTTMPGNGLQPAEENIPRKKGAGVVVVVVVVVFMAYLRWNQRSMTRRGVFDREQQGVNWSPNSRSSGVR